LLPRDRSRGRLAFFRRPAGRVGPGGLSLVADPRPHARRLLQGLPERELDRRRRVRRHRARLLMAEPGPSLNRFVFERGDLRGTQLTLFSSCLVHRSENYLETLPLGGLTAV